MLWVLIWIASVHGFMENRTKLSSGIIKYYLSRDMTKPTKWVCAQRRLRSAWASTQSDQSLRCPHEERVRSYPLSAQQRLWSDWADAQADLSLRWAHSHFVGFVMSRCICFTDSEPHTHLSGWNIPGLQVKSETWDFPVLFVFILTNIKGKPHKWISKWALSWRNLSLGFSTS